MPLTRPQELRPFLIEMMLHPFATHIVRTWLTLLSGRVVVNNSPIRSSINSGTSSLRSRRSTAFRARIAQSTLSSAPEGHLVFDEDLKQVIDRFLQDVDGPKIRDMSGNPFSSPTVALLLDLSPMDVRRTLLDLALDGFISAAHEMKEDEETGHQGTEKAAAKEDKEPGRRVEKGLERSAHVETLLRDSVGSHFLESCLDMCPVWTVDIFWFIYIRGRTCRLGSHKTANYVVAQILRRLSSEKRLRIKGEDALSQALQELQDNGDEVVKAGRLNVLQALVEHCGAVTPVSPSDADRSCVARGTMRRGAKFDDITTDEISDGKVARAVLGAFNIDTTCKVVPVILSMNTQDEWTADHARQQQAKAEGKSRMSADSQREPEIYGSVLLQSLCRLTFPSNDVVIRR